MAKYKVTERKITDYRPAEINPNAGNPSGLQIIEDSLRHSGAGRSLLADRDDELIAGSHTQEAAVNAGIEDVIELETDGNVLVVVKRRDLDLTTDAKAKSLQIADNRSNQVGYVPDEDIIGGLLAEIAQENRDLVTAAGYTAPDIQNILDSMDASGDEEIELTRYDVPDAAWPTDNDWGIPLLDINLQADAVDLPVTMWGATARTARMKGTWLFYTEDYRYEALWDDPTPILNSQCVNAAEPNYSCYGQMPLAVGLWAIYRKRWVARYWQSRGLRIFVDLNVHPRFYELNLLGVPTGWKAYATRGYADRIEYAKQEHQMACDRAGTSSVLFVVYGGGKAVKEAAQDNGWIWFDEEMNRMKRDG